jgi:hypothetical protein
MNLESRNFELETVVKQNDKKITALNKELDGLIKFSKDMILPKPKPTTIPTANPTENPTS